MKRTGTYQLPFWLGVTAVAAGWPLLPVLAPGVTVDVALVSVVGTDEVDEGLVDVEMAAAAAAPPSAQLFEYHVPICVRSEPWQTVPQMLAGSLFSAMR